MNHINQLQNNTRLEKYGFCFPCTIGQAMSLCTTCIVSLLQFHVLLEVIKCELLHTK